MKTLILSVVAVVSLGFAIPQAAAHEHRSTRRSSHYVSSHGSHGGAYVRRHGRHIRRHTHHIRRHHVHYRGYYSPYYNGYYDPYYSGVYASPYYDPYYFGLPGISFVIGGGHHGHHGHH